MIKKWTRSFCLLLAIMIMFVATVNPTKVYAAESPVTKVTGQPIKNGVDKWGKSGDTVITPFWGSYYYRITVNFAKSSKKTKIKLNYTHQIHLSKPGTIKLTVGKEKVTLCKFKSYPFEQDDITTKFYLESVEIRIGKKWKKVKITNDGVKSGEVYSEMKTLTLKKIPKGSKMRMTFNVWRVNVPRR